MLPNSLKDDVAHTSKPAPAPLANSKSDDTSHSTPTELTQDDVAFDSVSINSDSQITDVMKRTSNSDSQLLMIHQYEVTSEADTGMAIQPENKQSMSFANHDDATLCRNFLHQLKQLIGEKRFEDWFAHNTVLTLTDHVLRIGVPNPFLLRWMQRVFKKQCELVAHELIGSIACVEFEVMTQTHTGTATKTSDATTVSSKNSLQPNVNSSAVQNAAQNNPVNPDRSVRGTIANTKAFALSSDHHANSLIDADQKTHNPNVSRQDAAPKHGSVRSNAVDDKVDNKAQYKLSEAAASHDDSQGLGSSHEGDINVLPATEARGSLDDPTGIFSSSSSSGSTNAGSSMSKGQATLRPQATNRRVAPRTFALLDNFVANDKHRELMHSIEDVCQHPDGQISPLFLYGAIGNGKTHLLEGIYSRLREPGRNLKVMFLTAEQFANYYISALRDKTIPAFHQKFRQIDVLIVDDIEFMDGKHGIQEEFLKTIKHLEFHRKQIILSADRHPRAFMHTRVELLDRYSSGLVKRVEQPDEELRVAIVKQRAKFLLLEMNDDVCVYLARRFRGSVRELIGAINCLHSYHHLHRRKITMSVARELLSELERACLRIVRLTDVEQVVCDFFQIEPADLKSSARNRSISTPRMIAMYLMRKHTSAAYTEIGRQLGGRNHSTVLSAEKKVESWIESDSPVRLTSGEWTIKDILMTLEQKLLAC